MPRLIIKRWYEYDEPPYAPDGEHCTVCNFFTEKPWKWSTGVNNCAACTTLALEDENLGLKPLLVSVNIEHDHGSWWLRPADDLYDALEKIRWECCTSPGKVTRVEFNYEGDED